MDRASVPIGVALPAGPATTHPDVAGALAAEAERMGLAAIWVSDHVLLPPAGGPDRTTHQLDPLALLGWLAARTTTLRIGTSVLVLPYRDPLVAAKSLATTDWLSGGGRVVVGVGAGWLREEFDALGVPFGERVARTEEAIRVLRALWRGEQSFEGRWTRFSAMVSEPRAESIPILIGGNSQVAIELAATQADGWHPIALRPQAARAAIERYREACRAAGRPVGRVVLRWYHPHDSDPGERELFTGDDDAIRADVAAYVDAGVDELVVSPEATDPEGTLAGWQALALAIGG